MGAKKTHQSTPEQNEYKTQTKYSPLHKLQVIICSSIGLKRSEHLSRTSSVTLDQVYLESCNWSLC